MLDVRPNRWNSLSQSDALPVRFSLLPLDSFPVLADMHIGAMHLPGMDISS